MVSTEAKVTIAGNPVYNYEYVVLNQMINEHHTFTIGVDLEVVETHGTHTLDKAKNWLGESVMLDLHGLSFEGIVASVDLFHDKGLHGQIIVSGFSKTIDLDSIPHMQSWLNKNLDTIVKKATEGSKCNVKVSPKYTTPIEYESQYQETSFQFIQRLARQYNEWLYYDGKKLCFGKGESAGSINVEYGKDIYDITVGIQAVASKQKTFSYNSFSDEFHNGTTKDSVAGLNELGTAAFDASKKVFSIPMNSYTTHRVKSKGEIDDFLKRKQSSKIADVHHIIGKSKCKKLTVGTILNISAAIWESKAYIKKPYGSYIITEIKHLATVGEAYTNTFKAIPSGIQYLPEPNVPFPMADVQRAKVVSNTDPKKKGRVQVKMNWQTGEMKTSWIRVLASNAGKSDQVGTNRGFVFIPEVGDQVLVGFRYNDPNRPFVLGSLFDGKTGAGGNENNKIKSITTRSGSTIVFDDDSEKGKIVVRDPSGNTITLNGDETITVSAPKTITLTSTNIFLNGTEIELKGENIKLSAKKKIASDADEDVTVKGKNVIIGATKGANIDGGDKTEIMGTNITTNSKAETNITGNLVKINS